MEEDITYGVPPLSFVVENIYSSCVEENKEVVPVSTLLDFTKPHMSSVPDGISKLQFLLDPNNENPSVDRKTFYEAMQKWTALVENDLSSYSDETTMPTSTPKGSPTDENKALDASKLSPIIFNGDRNDRSAENHYYEEKLKEMKLKCTYAQSELSMMKSQLAQTEEMNAELQENLAKMNQKLLDELQKNECLSKSLDFSDISHENKLLKNKILDLKQELILEKKEKEDLVASLRDCELQGEQDRKKLHELQKNDEEKMRELVDLRSSLKECEVENEKLKKITSELEETLREQTKNLKHYYEISEMYKEDLYKAKKSKKGSRKSLPNMPALGTAINPKISILNSSNVYKNLYRPSIFDREIFSSSVFLRQLSLPVGSEETEAQKNNYSQSLDTVQFLDDAKDQTFFSKHSDTENDVCLNVSDQSTFDFSAECSQWSNPNFQEQNLLSELQDCKFLNNCCKCFKENAREISFDSKEYTKSIEDYEKKIETLESKIKCLEIENDYLSEQYKNVEIELIDERNAKMKLLDEVSRMKKQLIDLQNQIEEKDENINELIDFKHKYNEMKILEVKKENEFMKFKNKYKNLANEKDSLEFSLKESRKEKEELALNNKVIAGKLTNSENECISKEKQICEMQKEKIAFEMEISNFKREIERKKVIDKRNADIVQIKIINLSKKVQSLKENMEKSIEHIAKLKLEHEIVMNEVKTCSSTEKSHKIPQNQYIPVKETSEQPQLQKRYNIRKRTENELHFKINKLEDQVEFLEKKLSREKLISSKIPNLEKRLAEIEIEKINIEVEKDIISKELDSLIRDISLKNFQVFQLKRQMKTNLNQVRKLFESEKHFILDEKLQFENALIKTREKVKTLELKSIDWIQERADLLNTIENQKNKISSLKKVAFELQELKKEKNFVQERECLLHLNRETLSKLNISLQAANDRIFTLELMQSKYKMVLSETATRVFSAAKMAFDVWKHYLSNTGNRELLNTFNSLQNIEREFENDLTEEDIWFVNNRLILTSQLLEAMQVEYRNEELKESPLCEVDSHAVENISSTLNVDLSIGPDSEIDSVGSENVFVSGNRRINRRNTSWNILVFVLLAFFCFIMIYLQCQCLKYGNEGMLEPFVSFKFLPGLMPPH